MIVPAGGRSSCLGALSTLVSGGGLGSGGFGSSGVTMTRVRAPLVIPVPDMWVEDGADGVGATTGWGSVVVLPVCSEEPGSGFLGGRRRSTRGGLFTVSLCPEVGPSLVFVVPPSRVLGCSESTLPMVFLLE